MIQNTPTSYKKSLKTSTKQDILDWLAEWEEYKNSNESGKLKIFKRYWFISDDRPVNIEQFCDSDPIPQEALDHYENKMRLKSQIPFNKFKKD